MSLKRFSALFAFLLCAVLPAASRAQAYRQNREAKSSLPRMTGSASAAVTAPVNSLVIYVITQTDQDTWIDRSSNNKEVLILDFNSKIRPLRVTSLVGGYSYTMRGMSQEGVFTWDVVGEAVSQPGIYYDSWDVYNASPLGDITKDEAVTVVQRVVLVAPKSAP